MLPVASAESGQAEAGLLQHCIRGAGDDAEEIGHAKALAWEDRDTLFCQQQLTELQIVPDIREGGQVDPHLRQRKKKEKHKKREI